MHRLTRRRRRDRVLPSLKLIILLDTDTGRKRSNIDSENGNARHEDKLVASSNTFVKEQNRVESLDRCPDRVAS